MVAVTFVVLIYLLEDFDLMVEKKFNTYVL